MSNINPKVAVSMLDQYSRFGVFATGATLSDSRQALYNETDGYWYASKQTTFPVIVPPESTPGINWICVGLLNGNSLNNVRNWIVNANDSTIALQKMVETLSYFDCYDMDITGYKEIHFFSGISFSTPMLIRGSGAFRQSLIYHGIGDAITYTRQFAAHGFTLKQGGTQFTGRGLVCFNQQDFAVFEDFQVQNFLFGQVARYSIWCSYRNFRGKDNACHIRLLRSNNATEKYDPPATQGWNIYTGDGWFHNVLDMSMVTLEGGEIGLWGSPMCAVLTAPTCQGQKPRGLDGRNLVLPDSAESCAMYLQGGNTTQLTTSTNNWNIDINQLYIEKNNAGVIIEGYRKAKINLFIQGGTPANKMKFAVKAASGSHVIIDSIVGQDYFDNVFVSEKGSVIEYNNVAGPISGRFALADGVSQIIGRDNDRYLYLDATAGVENRRYLIGAIDKGFYELSIMSTTDNSSMYGAVFDLIYKDNNNWRVVFGSGDGDIKLIKIYIASGNLYLDVLIKERIEMNILLKNKLRMNRSGGMASSPITLDNVPR